MKELYLKYFMKQKMMRPLLLCLAVLMVTSIYYFGLRALLLYAINIFFAVFTEYLSEWKLYKKKKVSEAAVVTAILYTMTLPVSIPLWISAVGIIFGIFFGKEVFGGFGKNIFNPAIVGRAFIYVNFPEPLTVMWNMHAKLGEFPGGFAKYIFPAADTASGATPMLMFKGSKTLTAYRDLLLGNVGGVIGETCKVLIILAAIYLIYKKIASYEIMLGGVIGFTALTVALRAFGSSTVPEPVFGLLSGGFLLGIVLMATDPVSAAKTVPGKWIYGAIIGVVTVIIRAYALFAGGVMFAILIGNTFAPIIDYAFKALQSGKKEKRGAAA